MFGGIILIKLTSSEKKVYDYIAQVLSESSYPPSVRDIRDAVGFASTSTVHLYLSRLEEKGLIHRDAGKSRSISVLNADDTNGIPLVGKVRAGIPILAEENLECFIDYYPAFKSRFKKSELFALHVVGESMIMAGLLDGDIVIVHKTQEVHDGDIVVAMIGDEATVKTFYREKDAVRLQPENPSFTPIITRDLTVLGKVIASIRNY